MVLHPQIFNGNAALASIHLGIARSTILGWITTSVKKNCVRKWYDIVVNLTWSQVRERYNKELVAKFAHIDGDEKVSLEKWRLLRGDNVVLSEFCNVAPAKRARLARTSLQAKARGETSALGKFSLLNKPDKRQNELRPVKYPEMYKKVTEYILYGWHSGAPVTRQACYMKIFEFSGGAGMFWNQYLNPEKDTAPAQLSHWLTRTLKRMGFSSRKETISQKIPDNWKELSKDFSTNALDYLRKNEVDLVITADQTFLNLLLAKDDLLVPTGIRRVGTSVEGDDFRKGVSLMLTAYIWKERNTGTLDTGLLPPFIVFNGKTGKTLDKRYRDWSRREGHTGSMNFQSRHWFDAVITLR